MFKIQKERIEKKSELLKDLKDELENKLYDLKYQIDCLDVESQIIDTKIKFYQKYILTVINNMNEDVFNIIWEYFLCEKITFFYVSYCHFNDYTSKFKRFLLNDEYILQIIDDRILELRHFQDIRYGIADKFTVNNRLCVVWNEFRNSSCYTKIFQNTIIINLTKLYKIKYNINYDPNKNLFDNFSDDSNFCL